MSIRKPRVRIIEDKDLTSELKLPAGTRLTTANDLSLWQIIAFLQKQVFNEWDQGIRGKSMWYSLPKILSNLKGIKVILDNNEKVLAFKTHESQGYQIITSDEELKRLLEALFK